jgi:hypothetical protein
MVPHQESAAPEPRARTPKKRKKRFVTSAMRSAARANSKKSTGPSEAARARTRFNGVVHGMASQQIMFLKNENPGHFWSEVDLWCTQRGAVTEDERSCIADAVYSRWVKRRVINAQVHAANEAIEDIEDHFEERKAAEVQDLIPNLKAKPGLTVTELMNSTCGCTFLITEFTALSERLTTHYSFEVSQREHALRVGGHRPKELFTDTVVKELNRSYLGSLQGPGGFTAAGAANAFIYDKPEDISDGEFERRLERHILDLPTIEEGHAQLQRYVKGWIDRLTERHELMGYRESRQKLTAIGKAQIDTSAAGEKRVRYLNQSDRNFYAAMRTVLALKAERRKYGEADIDEAGPGDAAEAEVAADVATDPVAMVPEAAVIPAVEDQKPSEAVAPQVVGPVVGNNATSAAPAVVPAGIGARGLGIGGSDPGSTAAVGVAAVEDQKPSEAVAPQVVGLVVGNNATSAAPAVVSPAVVPSHGDPLLAVIEKYKSEFAHLREYDHLE